MCTTEAIHEYCTHVAIKRKFRLVHHHLSRVLCYPEGMLKITPLRERNVAFSGCWFLLGIFYFMVTTIEAIQTL